MALDKWQQREAQQLADEQGVTYEQAVTQLFPEGEPAPVAAAGEQAPGGDPVTLTK